MGISSPDDMKQIVKTFDVIYGLDATSRDYEKGVHIIDPYSGLIAFGACSVSVRGPDGALCDALATALMVDGRDAQRWMGRPELAEYGFRASIETTRLRGPMGLTKGY